MLCSNKRLYDLQVYIYVKMCDYCKRKDFIRIKSKIIISSTFKKIKFDLRRKI
jgi:hypothetical protein